MAKQSRSILQTCQHPKGCSRPATIGIYKAAAWNIYNQPFLVCCGRHKPSPTQIRQHGLRCIKIKPITAPAISIQRASL